MPMIAVPKYMLTFGILIAVREGYVKMAGNMQERMSREDFKKKQELDELRKSGAIEPEKDADGNEINPHIPQYMSQAPWYLNAQGPGLKHTKDYRNMTVAQGIKARQVQGSVPSKVISRKRDEFGERTDKPKKKTDLPRANGYDGSYAGKRDRWNGYDPNQFVRVLKKHELVTKERQAIREKMVDESLQGGGNKDKKAKEQESDSDSSSDDEEQKVDADKAELLDNDGQMLGQQLDEGRVGMQTRVSVRNLRIREDTAKYLRNLDPKSAFYDPKTRSMRSNPNPDRNPTELDYAGDNFERYSGDTRKVASQQLYEFAAYDRGQEVHMIAMPTQAEKLHGQFQEKQETLKDTKKEKLFDQYGGAEHVEEKLPDRLRFGGTEVYREYTQDGNLIKGQENVVLNAKYEEDKLTNNHTKIWGSYWYNGKWGYSCCCGFIRNSYCTGEAGKAAFDKQKGERIGQSPLCESASINAAQMKETIKAFQKKEVAEKDPNAGKKITPGERNEGKDITDFDKKKLKAALDREEDLINTSHAQLDDRKRGYNSMGSYEVTQEEMEAYMLKKSRGNDDPLAVKGKKGEGGYDFV